MVAVVVAVARIVTIVESLVVPIVVDAVNWKFPSWFGVGPVGW